MDDAALRSYWPSLGAVVAALREAGHDDVVRQLDDAVCGGATSSEIVGCVGLVLRAHDTLRAPLDAASKAAWDAVMRDVNRLYPPRALAYWFRRLLRP